MNERSNESLEERSRALFQDSVDGLDFAMRSRLTQARHAALAAVSGRPRSRWSRLGIWLPAAGVTAALVLASTLWLGSPLGHHAVTVENGQSNFEDLEIVASTDESSGDTMDMLQDDIEFYDWADRAATPGPVA